MAAERTERTGEPAEPGGVPGDDTCSDAALLAAHVAGDSEAFGLLIARHRDRLWAVALRTSGDPDTAADGLQDAVMAAFRRAESFRGDAAVTTWLHRIVVNACLDRLRAASLRRSRTQPLPEEPDRLEALASAAAPRTPEAADPVEAAVGTERRARVQEALATLGPDQRAAVVLVDMEGYSVAEVARMLDCAEGTVKSRCSRARARLAVLLADVLLPDDAPTSLAPPTGTRGDGDGNPARDPRVGSVVRRGPPGAGAAPASTAADPGPPTDD